MDANLQELIEKRKKQAQDLNIESKANCIASGLGNDYRIKDRDRWGHGALFLNKDFEICFEVGEVSYGSDGAMGFARTTINYKKETVFKAGGCQVYSFIPGEWLTEFEDLYSKSEIALEEKKKAQEAQLQEEQRRQDQEERKKWGL